MGEISKKAGLKRQRGAELRAIDVCMSTKRMGLVFSAIYPPSQRSTGARAYTRDGLQTLLWQLLSLLEYLGS